MINVFNIDQLRLIRGAAVKKQCSGDYFYGQNQKLENAIQFSEQSYAYILREILAPGFQMSDTARTVLRHFWLLQYMRTDAASRRAIERNDALLGVSDDAQQFRMGIREAVQASMRAFVETMHIMQDLKVCLFRNRTSIPFVTSDDPAVLTNRWYLEDSRVRGRSFGLKSSGDLTLLPLSPQVLFLGYDGDVYNVPHQNGWVDIRHEGDIHVLNQHQYLNCRANIFTVESQDQPLKDSLAAAANIRPVARHVQHIAVRDREEGNHVRYRVVNPDAEDMEAHDEVLVHLQTIHARPSAWPRQIQNRPRGKVYSNGTGVGYVREHYFRSMQLEGFQREFPWQQ